MLQIILSICLSILISSCSSSGNKKQEYVENFSCPEMKKGEKSADTSNCTLEISLPTTPEHAAVTPSRWVALGEARGLGFKFGLNKGNYWVEVTKTSFSASNEGEVILNIKSSGESNPESINLVKISNSTFKGAGYQRVGLANFVLIYKVPKQKEIIFDFDLEAN